MRNPKFNVSEADKQEIVRRYLAGELIKDIHQDFAVRGVNFSIAYINVLARARGAPKRDRSEASKKTWQNPERKKPVRHYRSYPR